MLFSSECLGFLPALFWQLNPWWPNSVTEEPQAQICGRQIGAPSLSAMQTLNWLLFKNVPICFDGMALIQAFDSLHCRAKNRALFNWSGKFNSLAMIRDTLI